MIHINQLAVTVGPVRHINQLAESQSRWDRSGPRAISILCNLHCWLLHTQRLSQSPSLTLLAARSDCDTGSRSTRAETNIHLLQQLSCAFYLTYLAMSPSW